MKMIMINAPWDTRKRTQGAVRFHSLYRAGKEILFSIGINSVQSQDASGY